MKKIILLIMFIVFSSFYVSSVSINNLSFAWTMDETSGTLIEDVYKHAYNVTAPVNFNPTPNGKNNYYRKSIVNETYLSAISTNDIVQQNTTTTFWYYVGSNEFLRNPYFNSRLSDSFYLEILNGGQVRCSFHRHSGGDINTAFANVVTGHWYFFSYTIYEADTKHNATCKMYNETGSVFNVSIFGDWENRNDQPRNVGIQTYYTNDGFDELYYFNVTLSNNDLDSLYYNGAGLYYPLIDTYISFISPTPDNNTVNNTYSGIQIAVQSNNNNISLFWNGTLIGNGSETSPYIVTLNSSMVTGAGSYNYSATNGNRSINRTWVYDPNTPTITFNPSTTFLNNLTTNPYNGILLFNLTISDARDLYAFEALATNGATVYFNFTLLNLTGTTSYTFVNETNFTKLAFPYSRYNLSISFSDSHTAKEIKPYATKKVNNGIEFDTAEKNNIAIYSEDSADFTAIKQKDRYQFEYKAKAKGNKDRVFYLRSDKTISYLPRSEYKGHFVIWNSQNKNGNWVDFDGLGVSPNVEKITETEYKITFSNVKDEIVFNSIGGLNVVTQDYLFEYTNLTVNSVRLLPITPINSSDVFAYVNVTDYLGKNINYSYSWFINNVNTLNGVLLNQQSDKELLISTLGASYTNIGDNITFSFNASSMGLVTTTQRNATINVSNWAIDLCNVFTTSAFNLNIKDEASNIIIIANSTTDINAYGDTDSSQTNYFQLQALNNGSLNYCKNPTNLTITGDLLATLSKSGYNPTTFYLYDTVLSGDYTAYMVATSASTQQVTYTIKGSDGNTLSGASFKVYRVINGTNTLIHNAISNIAGQIVIYQDSLITYSYEISKDSYTTSSFNLQPTATAYTFTLSPASTSYFNNPYEGIRYRVTPSGTLFLASSNYTNFTFRVEGTGFTAIGMNLSHHNYSCVPASCAVHLLTTTDAEVSVLINVSNYGTVNSAYYFVLNGERIYINDNILKWFGYNYTTNTSMVQLMEYVKSVTTPNERALMFAFVEVSALGIGALFGIVGSFALLIATGLIIFASLPEIGLINPILGLVFAVFGLALYFKFQVEREH